MDPEDTLKRIRALKRELEEVARAFGVEDVDEAEAGWQDFLAAHPELTERPQLEVVGLATRPPPC